MKEEKSAKSWAWGQKTRGRRERRRRVSVSFPPREGIAGSRSVGQRAVGLQQHGRLSSRHTVATLHQVDQSYFVETKEFARGARRHLDPVSSHAFSTVIPHLPRPRSRLNPANAGNLVNASRVELRCVIWSFTNAPLSRVSTHAMVCVDIKHRRSIEPMSDRYVSIRSRFYSRSISYPCFACSLKVYRDFI